MAPQYPLGGNLADLIASAAADYNGGAGAHIGLRNRLFKVALVALYHILSNSDLENEFVLLARKSGIRVRSDTPIAAALAKIIFGTRDKDVSSRYGQVLRAGCVLEMTPDALEEHLRDRRSMNELIKRSREAMTPQTTATRMKRPTPTWSERAKTEFHFHSQKHCSLFAVIVQMDDGAFQIAHVTFLTENDQEQHALIKTLISQST